ncbi:MAG: response regulator [Spirochaetes bacterium]|nr:response regulator [Spirochaetota bacterium]
MTISVLFVDDDKSLLDGIKRVATIENEDMVVDTATSAEEALKLLESKKYDVVVSDQRMPGMEGLTLLSLIRVKYPDIKRIMLSAQVNEDVYKSAETVAHRYIAKPCDFDIILKEIESLCS